MSEAKSKHYSPSDLAGLGGVSGAFGTMRTECFWFDGIPKGLICRTRSRITDEVESSLARLETTLDILADCTYVPDVKGFGADAQGYIYLVFDLPMVQPLSMLKGGDQKLQEQATCDLVRAVGQLHHLGIVLGEISPESFCYQKNEEKVWLVGFLGEVIGPDTGIARANSGQISSQWVAAENRSGLKPDFRSDVYCIGSVIYWLFVGKSPASIAGGTSSLEAPSRFCVNLSPWVDYVTGLALHSRPEERFPNAIEMYRVIDISLRSGAAPESTGYWSAVRDGYDGASVLGGDAHVQSAPSDSEEKSKSSVLKTLMLVGAGSITLLLAFGISIVIFLILSNDQSPLPVQDSDYVVSDKDSSPSAELRIMLSDLGVEGISVERRRDIMKQMALSEDRESLRMLLSWSYDSGNPLMVQQAVGFVPARILQQGQKRVSEVLGKWLSKNNFSDETSRRVLWLIIQATSSDLSIQDRVKSLYSILDMPGVVSARDGGSYRNLTILLATALALDTGQAEFLEVSRELVAGITGELNVRAMGLYAIVGFYEPLYAEFGLEARANLDDLTVEELRWLVPTALARKDELLFFVADQLVARGNLDDLALEFGKTLQQERSTSLPGSVLGALVDGLLDRVSVGSVEEIARWKSSGANQLLFAVCLYMPESKEGLVALQALASRSLPQEPLKSILGFVQEYGWERKAELVWIVGRAGNFDKASYADARKIVEQLKGFVPDKDLYAMLVRQKGNMWKVLTLEFYGDHLSTKELLSYLIHESADARIAALRALASRREYQVEKYIQKKYKTESDEKVKKVYKELYSELIGGH